MAPFVEPLDRYTLLRRSASEEARFGRLPGVYDLMELVLFWNEGRLMDDMPRSARLVPEEDRWKTGWLGRDAARECLDPDSDRAWPVENGAPWPAAELDRFIADGGCGRAELPWMLPRVWIWVSRRWRWQRGASRPA